MTLQLISVEVLYIYEPLYNENWHMEMANRIIALQVSAIVYKDLQPADGRDGGGNATLF